MPDGLPRVFRFNGSNLEDPNSAMTPDQVRTMYATSGFAELTNASVVGPEEKDGKLIYTFNKAVGTKG